MKKKENTQLIQFHWNNGERAAIQSVVSIVRKFYKLISILWDTPMVDKSINSN